MKTNHIYSFLALSIFIFLGFNINASYNLNPTFNSKVFNSDTLIIEFYTGIGCPSCKRIEGYIHDIELKYRGHILIYKYEVYRNKDNFRKMIAKYNDYGIGWDRHWVPVIFFDDKCLIGYTEIDENLDQEIKKRLGILIK